MTSKPLHRILALESATDALSVALLDGERVVVLREHEGARQHSAALLPLIDEVLHEAGTRLDALDAMAISAGPGSFTSLRIGLATLKGLAFGRELPVIGVSTLEAMALGVFEDGAGREPGPEVDVLALLDARRGEWYAGAWRRPAAPGELPIPTLAEGLYAPSRLAADLPRAVVAVSPEAAGWRRRFEDAGLPLLACVEGHAARPRADRVGRLAFARLARGEGESAATLSARYLRRAEAEARRTGRAVEEGETERLERS